MTKKHTIIITGANGLVGSELVRHFSSVGYNVRALVRNPDQYKNTQTITYFTYDMTKKPNKDIFHDADYLVHTAYIKEPSEGKGVIELNVNAAQALIEMSRAHKLKKNIFMSSMSADKDSVAAYARQKYAIERSFNTNSDVVIRSGLVIGDGGLAKQIINFMSSKHIAPLIDGGKQPLQIIGVNELAQVIHAIIKKNITGTLYIGTPEVYTYREFYKIIKSRLNISALLLPVPFFLPLLAIRLVNLLQLPIDVTEDNLQGLKRLRAYDTKKDLATVGITLSSLEAIVDAVYKR